MNRFSCLVTMAVLCLALPPASHAAPIHDAARAGDVAKMRQLIDAGADFRAKDERQQSPMDVAAANGRVEIIALLLAKGVNVNAPNAPKGPYNLNMPLFLAAQGGQLEAIKLLIRKDAKTGKPDQKELNALLRVAVQQYGGGRESMVKWLIEQGADVNASFGELSPNFQEEDAHSLLQLASVRQNDKIVSLLVAHGAKVKAGEDEGSIMLGWAAAEGRVDKLKKLLEQGANANACLAEIDEVTCLTPLELAVRNGRVKAAELLLQHDASLNISYVGTAICQHNLPMVKMLTKYYKDVGDGPGFDANSYALAQTVTCGDKATLAFLMGRTQPSYEQITRHLQSLFNPYDRYGERAERLEPDPALFSTLFAGDAEIKQHASVLLAPAISGGHDKIAVFLYGKGASLNAEEGSGLLLGVATAGHAGSAELLLKHGVKPDGRSGWGNTPLLRAAPYGYTDVAEVLLKYGADVNAKNELFNTPLHMAAARNNVKMATLLINHGARVNAVNGDGNTPMHQSVRYPGQFDVLKLLLDKKAKVNIKNKRGMTPLHYLAIRNTDYSEYDDASKEGEQNQYPYTDRNGLAPYQRPDMMRADETERVNAVKLLLDNGADPNIKNMNGDSALDLERKYSKNKEIVRLMEAREKKDAKPAKP